MSSNSKLSKVLEYLIKNDEEKAKELLHQVFIEKARAIHEEMMGHDDMEEDEVGGSGDQGKDFRNAVNARGQDAHSDAIDAQIRAMENEIDFEETMNEEEGDLEEFKATTDDEDELELSLDDDGDEMDMDVTGDEGSSEHDDHEAIMDKMGDLETALAELKAEFEKLEAEERGEGEEEEEGEGEEEEESWEMDEDFDDIAESLDLEVVTKDMEKSVPAKDVGAEQSGMSDGNKARSPLPPSQTTRFGAKPVDIGAGPDHKGYELETAPKSNMDAMKLADPDMKADNRRKSYSNGMSRQNKEGNKPDAAINTTAKQFGADTVGKMSPLSKGGQNLK
jgi:hypothetical protein